MEEKKKSKKGLIIGIIAGIVVVLGIIITVVVAKFGILGVNPKAILNTAKKVNDGEIEPEAFIDETLNENYEIADAKKEDVFIDVSGSVEVKDLKIDYLECDTSWVVPEGWSIPATGTNMAKTKFRYTNIGSEPLAVNKYCIGVLFEDNAQYIPDCYCDLEEADKEAEATLQPNESIEFYVYFDISQITPTIEYYDYEYYTEKHIYFTIK